jgi:isopenicillin N synthase-like dioxygenase
LKETGFVYIKNSPLTDNIINNCINTAKNFFEQSQNIKNQLHTTDTNAFGYYHYQGVGNADRQIGSSENNIEAYLLSNPLNKPLELKSAYFDKTHPHSQQQREYWTHQINQWPSDKDFKKSIEEYYKKSGETSELLLTALALALDLSSTYFTSKHDKHDSTMELKKYHKMRPQSNEDVEYITLKNGVKIPKPKAEYDEENKDYKTRVNVHADLSSITLLSQNEVGGLQVLRSDGQWIDAPKIKDCILVNTGDIMERWTNGYYKSTLHRVAFNEQSEKSDRYSVVYFCMPNWEQALEPITGDNNGSHRAQPSEKKETILFGDMIPFV